MVEHQTSSKKAKLDRPVEEGESSSALGATTATPSTSNLPPLPICQVDRFWLQKLILKHHHQDVNVAQSTADPEFLRKNVKIYASAPMVDQSDLAYRLQCRKYGTNLCFTPMIHAKLFCTMQTYRAKFGLKNIPPTDRPLIAQLCGGSDPETMLQCALQLQDYCDGIDINCGCPQGIARRGNYGAFLLEQEETLLTLVKHMAPRLKVPLSVKVRLLPEEDVEKRRTTSLNLYTKLADAGIHLLTVHGRTRHQKKDLTGAADWDAISSVVKELSHRIPILANGSIGSVQDIQDCLNATNADGIMSSEAILEYPPLFEPMTLDGKIVSKPRVARLALAREYLDLASQYPPEKGGQASGFKCIRVHMHRFLHSELQVYTDIRDTIVRARDVEGLKAALTDLEKIYDKIQHNPQEEELSWYLRYRVEQEPCKIPVEEEEENNENKPTEEVEEEAPPPDMGGSIFGAKDDGGDY